MRRSFYALCATFLLFSVPNLNAQTSQTKAEKKALQHSHIDGNKIAFFSHDDWEKCGQVAHTDYLRQQDPNYNHKFQISEQMIQDWIAANPDAGEMRGNIYTIPVVVHVVYQNASQNVSNAQINTMLNRLNADFRKTNSDASNVPAPWQGIAADMEIEFCLAQRDETGGASTGITRRQTSTGSFGTNDAVKFSNSGGTDAWDVTRFFNMWIAPLQGGLLGYAEFPSPGLSNTYGVVVETCTVTGACPPFNLGRTMTHEVGHALGLFHTWGDDGGSCNGSDQVADTPNQGDATNGCPGYPATDNCATSSPGYMFMNFMDYSNDACTYMFTNGQKARARASVNNFLMSLVNSNSCIPVTGDDAGVIDIINPTGAACNTTFTPVIEIRNFGGNTLTSVTISYQVDNGTIETYNWTGSLPSAQITEVTLPDVTVSAGSHTLTVYTSNPNSATDLNGSNDSYTTNFDVNLTGTLTPLAQGFEAGSFPPAGWTLDNPDGSFTFERTNQAASSGNWSIYINNYDYAANGEVDELTLEMMDLSNATDAELTFDLAYALYSAVDFSDTLQVLISTDCGFTWNVAYHKFDDALTTVPNITEDFFIPTAQEWREETVDLNPYLGNSTVLVKFRHATDYENNLYIDDINIDAITSIEDHGIQGTVSVYPNPSNGMAYIDVQLNTAENVKIEVLNGVGELVTSTEEHTRKTVYELNLTNHPAGIYYVNVKTETGSKTEKIILTR